ncbi:nucleic acid binding protein [Dorcoceras hygrometricum]|uniref:Nucleic acid binding protein n=1 Tax=Dorcoceras hygrometricum TaxID=472368 RepID=A0A2Z7CVJ5_9LAMI|nr:nucleic acid binding protein [Dorcoceras hygrometricum]
MKNRARRKVHARPRQARRSSRHRAPRVAHSRPATIVPIARQAHDKRRDIARPSRGQHAVVTLPAHDRGRPSRGQREMVSRMMHDVARTSRPPCTASAHGIAPPARGITDSACKNQLVMVSVQDGHFNPYIPIRSTTIGKSRVAKDPIAMHTSWRSNSDIASATSIGYPRMSASGESSTTMHRLLHASGSHPIPPPNDPKFRDCTTSFSVSERDSYATSF